MKHLRTFIQKTNEGWKDKVIAGAMMLAPLAVKSQDSKWVNRAANANLHFWEKCKLAASPDKSGSASYSPEKSYKNNYERMADVSSYDKDTRKKLKETCPDGIDMKDWAALNQEAARVSAVFSNTDYDKFVDSTGSLIQDLSHLDEKEQQSMMYGISYLEPYFVYYRAIFPKAKRITATQLLDYWQKAGGLEKFKEMLNTGYRGL
jgi:hypothetical protein